MVALETSEKWERGDENMMRGGCRLAFSAVQARNQTKGSNFDLGCNVQVV